VPDDVLKAGAKRAPGALAAERKEWEARSLELGPRKARQKGVESRRVTSAGFAAKAFRDHRRSAWNTLQRRHHANPSEAVTRNRIGDGPFAFLAGSADRTGSTNKKASRNDRFSARREGPLHPLRHREHGMAPRP